MGNTDFSNDSDWAKTSKGWELSDNKFDADAMVKPFYKEGGAAYGIPLFNDLTLWFDLRRKGSTLCLDNPSVRQWAWKNHKYWRKKIFVWRIQNAWRNIKNRFAGNKARHVESIKVVEGLTYKISFDVTCNRKTFKNLRISLK